MSTSITQDLEFRYKVVTFALKYGVIKAAIKYQKTKQFVSFWKCRYDGTVDSLRFRSHKPHHHPNEHTPKEIQLICNVRRRCPEEGLVEFWLRLRGKGYKRTILGMYRAMVRLGYFDKKTKKKKPKAGIMEPMTRPGEKIQIDVKVVPKKCISSRDGEKWYQYTAIDEFTRLRYLEGFKEHSTYSSAQFIVHAKAFFEKKYGFTIECVQTDNGFEFTNRFSKGNRESLFEQVVRHISIKHKLIRPFTPRHNGKVERSHREDQKRFYEKRSFYSFEDFNKQLKAHLVRSNQMPMRPLGYLSPIQYLNGLRGKI